MNGTALPEPPALFAPPVSTPTFKTSLLQRFLMGLVCNFRQERGDSEALDHRKFIEWLEYHRHEDVKNLIVRTHHLPREIDEILRRDQKEILQKLTALDDVLVTLLARIEGFAGIVSVMSPGAGISPQAQRILVSFAETDCEFLVLMDNQGTSFLLFSPGHGRDVPEPRFLVDDVNTLFGYGFITPEYGNGEPTFRLTRNGATYARLLKESGVEGGL